MGGFDPHSHRDPISPSLRALEGRVLRCKPTLVTLRIDPSLAAFLGQHATDLLDPDDKIYPVVKRSTILDAAVSSQTKSNPRGEENDQQDHRSDLQQ